MWASRYFNPRYWAARFWAKIGAVSVQTQDAVRVTREAISWSALHTESVTNAELDAQAVTYATMADETVG